MDPFAVAVDVVSVAVLLLLVITASRAVRAYRQSRRTLTESAGVIGAIVNALSSRIELSESAFNDLRSEFDTVNHRTDEIKGQQQTLRSSYLQLLRYLEELLSNDRRLISELQQIKDRLSSHQERLPTAEAPATRERSGMPMTDGEILARLTDTERQTVEILAREGPKAAPELGRRLKRSREHTSRLMKKLYLEGYIDRESNHAPYRYRLNEKVLASLGPAMNKAVTAKASEKA